MTAPVAFTRTTYGINDTLEPADFNAQSALSATVRDAAAGQSGVMPDTTTAAGLAMVIAASVAAQRTLLGLGTADTPTFRGSTLTGDVTLSGVDGTSAHGNIYGPSAAGKALTLLSGNTTGGIVFRKHDYTEVGNYDQATDRWNFSSEVALASKFGCNGTTPQAKAVSGGTLAGVIAALVANGILSS